MKTCFHADAVRHAVDEDSYLIQVAKLQRTLHDLVDLDVAQLVEMAQLDNLWSFNGFGIRDRGMTTCLAEARAALAHLERVRAELRYLQRWQDEDFQPSAGKVLKDPQRPLPLVVSQSSGGEG